MRKLCVALALVAALIPSGVHAIDVPGLGLDHPGLEDHFFGFYGDLGRYAYVKGAPTGSAPSGLLGHLKVVQMPRAAYALSYGWPWASSDILSSTLVPVFAAGAVGHNTGGGGYLRGPFAQAILYEPDHVKRKGGPGEKSRLQLKQKSYLAFRFGQFAGTGGGVADTISATVVLESCKAQVDSRNDPSKPAPTGSARMKVKCSGKGAPVQSVRDRLGAIFGKSKSGFEVRARF